MKRKILLTGKNGQLGSELRHLLPRFGEMVALGHDDIDLSDTVAIRDIVRQLRPQLIVNAAAHTAVDSAETERDVARKINTEAPTVLAEEAEKLRATLLHYSTDYVFDGSKSGPYHETDPANPINFYGETKLAGEQAIQQTGTPHVKSCALAGSMRHVAKTSC